MAARRGRDGASTVGVLLVLLAFAAAVYWWMGREKQGNPAADGPMEKGTWNAVRAAAEKGDAEAAWKMGLIYADGLVVDQNWREAAAWFRRAAQAGNPKGLFQLGLLYETGKGVVQDWEQAAGCYWKAAEQGDPDAQWKMGLFHRDGRGVARDPVWAKIWLEKAAQQGHREAETDLAKLELAPGEGNFNPLEQDLAEAEGGDAWAQCRMGRRCLEGLGVERDDAAGAAWYRKAAEQGSLEGQCRWGDCLRFGRGVEKDEAKAEEWYRKAAERGHPEGQRLTAQCRMAAGARAEAVVWLKNAADGGDAEGQYLLALCFQKGMGTEKNPAAAKKWLRTAAQNGHPKARSVLVASRSGAAEDGGLAARAKQGDLEAQYKLGRKLLDEGEEREGMQWVQMAAQGGLMEAMLWQGLHYQFGLGSGGRAGGLGAGGDILGMALSGQ